MSMPAAVELIILTLDKWRLHDSVVQRLIKLDREGAIELYRITVLGRDPAGNIHVQETSQVAQWEGAVVGAAAGGVLGLVGGRAADHDDGHLGAAAGVVVGAAAGAAIGYEVGHVVERDLADEHLRALAGELAPSSEALLIITGSEFVEVLVDEMGDLVSGMARFRLAARAREAAQI
jgi:uncharacterized membrane protein